MKIKTHSARDLGRLCLVSLAVLTLVSCGGGGGSAGTASGGNLSGGSSGGTSTGTGSGTSSGSTASNATVSTGQLGVAMVTSAGAETNSLSGGQTGTVKATFKSAAGAALSNAVVKFTASDSSLVDFTPASGSALTDANGVAVINVKPRDFSSAGALTITASASTGSVSGSATTNIAVGAAPLSVGALAFSPAPSGSLAAFSTATLSIPVTSNGQPVDKVSGLTVTSLCVGDGTATIVIGSLSNGIQSATYTNNGCLRGTDTITAAIGTSSKTITLPVSSANIGAIQFVGSNLTGTSMVLKGSGGLGRLEAAQLTYKVVDQNNNPLAGVDVNFRATTTTGGLTVQPVKGTTDASGVVRTTVSSGTIPTPVRVIAEASRNNLTLSGLSDALTITTGFPIQKNMSLSPDAYNFEGWGFDNEIAKVTVLLADQYGNPVSDGTTVNFVTEGGAIGSSAQGACNTTNGGCTVQLRSQDFRPANGRVTVLAYVQGLEDFVDANGDGQYSCTSFVGPDGVVPPVYRPLVDTCVSGGESFTDQGDPFLDTGVATWDPADVTSPSSLDGNYDVARGDQPFPYGHTAFTPNGDGKWGLNYIRRSIEMVFSGSNATLIRQVCNGTAVDNKSCRDWTSSDGNPMVLNGVAGASCSNQPLVFRLTDLHNNPLPAGTTVSSADGDKIGPLTIFPSVVPSINAIGGSYHQMVIKTDAGCASGGFTLKVKTPKGMETGFAFRSN
ncbi:Ig-like domain-containing protein [Noviherbaspirillum galbum]|uniref:Big-1 domain-containing protein n=1 Tax=Noviherbaspirillum galbum TaxID=2709383 RepID=A0A6B3SSP0_9BURK|nr:Ig-like domain-containing protein [Noviherbaspirillum galbum]NEX61462.1 hypothetical protein [Noviherbaspirillum galbum]